MKVCIPFFKYNRDHFERLFDECTQSAPDATAIVISGVNFYDSFAAETVDITVTMSKKVRTCPRLADRDVTTMLPAR